MHITGPYIEGAGTFAVQLHQLTGPDDARNTVNFWADQGVTSYKIYNYVTRAEMKATNDAKAVLTGALGVFRQLGARAWAQRTEAELRACGVSATGAPGE